VYPDIVLGNPNISPETNTEIETGFDATMFNSRAQFSATVYQKKISNVILLDQIAPSYGQRYQWLNGGQFTNQGIELSLTGTPIQSRNGLTWVSTATFYRNYSRVDNLPLQPFDVGGVSSIAQFGAPFGSFKIQPGRSVTEIVNENFTGPDGLSRQVGDGQPDFQMSFIQQVDWKRLHFYALVDWKYGGNTINLTNAYYDNGLYLLADSAASAQRTTAVNAGLAPYVEGGGYVKLREITIGYDLPAAWVRTIGTGRLSNVRVSLSGYNLLSSYKYTGLDPEISNFGSQNITRAQDVTPYPPARSFFFSVDLGF
jgi:outer membrane receptor protein involved in Fe transport